MLFAFVSCGEEINVETTVPETQATETKGSFLNPTKTELSKENQQIVDQYYQEMISLYPQFGTIPREMLIEKIYLPNDSEYFDVSFTFCFGGIPTGCRCNFATSPRYPQGKWSIEENEFSQFYQSGLSESVMLQIRSSLLKGVSEYIDTYHLEKAELSDKNLPLYWQITDGKIYACCEHIANTTLLTTKQYGCETHAHIFGRILVELSDETVQLIISPTIGS